MQLHLSRSLCTLLVSALVWFSSASHAAETLRVLHEMNKPVVFLSNAPRVSAKAQANLDRLGIPRNQYLEVVTSGQVAHDLLARMEGGLTPPSQPTAATPAASGSPSATLTPDL